MPVRFPCTARAGFTKLSGAAPGALINLTIEESRFLIAAKEAVAPTGGANTLAPAVTGTVIVGNSLSCTQGTWTGANLVFMYDWQRINGPRRTYGNGASTYLLDATDVGFSLRCVVTATNGAGPVRANSNTVGPVTAT